MYYDTRKRLREDTEMFPSIRNFHGRTLDIHEHMLLNMNLTDIVTRTPEHAKVISFET